jgi:uncharacterized protein YkwD
MAGRMQRTSALLSLSLLSGCMGVLANGGDDTDRDAGGSDRDARVVREDAGTPIERDAAMPDGGPDDPCAAVRCGSNAHCSAGTCVCDEGFVDSGGGCTSLPPGDPAGRTQAEVCDAWNAGRVENASPAWTEGSSTCDAGTMAEDAIDDTLRRVNMYRWLAGLPAVPHDASRHQELMECANMMNVNNMLSHTPPDSWSCYTAGGAGAAGRSNIALGYPTPGSAIDGYMEDSRTPSLGHRRWILSAGLGSVEIGFAGRGQCLGVFGGGGSSDRAWTAYPNQGFAPIDLAFAPWSFQANTIGIDGGTTVEVRRMSDGASLAVTVSFIGGGFGPPSTMSFTPSGWTPSAGESYQVTIRGTSEGDITYEVSLVSC